MSRITQIRAILGSYREYPLQLVLRRTTARLPKQIAVKIAVIDAEQRFTYQQLDENSDRFAAPEL